MVGEGGEEVAKTVRETADVCGKVKEGARGSYQQCTVGVVVFMHYISTRWRPITIQAEITFYFSIHFLFKKF